MVSFFRPSALPDIDLVYNLDKGGLEGARITPSPSDRRIQFGVYLHAECEAGWSSRQHILQQMSDLKLGEDDRIKVTKAFFAESGINLDEKPAPPLSGLMLSFEKAVRRGDAPVMAHMMKQAPHLINAPLGEKRETALEIVLAACYDNPTSRQFSAAKAVLVSAGAKTAEQLRWDAEKAAQDAAKEAAKRPGYSPV